MCVTKLRTHTAVYNSSETLHVLMPWSENIDLLRLNSQI